MADDPYGTEVWKVIPGFEDYSASSVGRIRRETPGMGARPGRVLTQEHPKDGYPTVVIYLNRVRKHIRVHNLVAAAFLGKRPPDHDVCHNNGLRSDNRLENLRYATRSENNMDKLAHGTLVCGTRHHAAKLDELKVREIRDLAEGGARQNHIAQMFRLDETTVSDVIRRKSWKHVQ